MAKNDSTAIGVVSSMVGTVKAVDQNGVERVLQVGDSVYANETIVTSSGALVLVEFSDGSRMDLAPDSSMLLDSEVFNPDVAKAAELSAEQIQEMIAAGMDPAQAAAAAAAGGGCW